jgi:hypothetical protein
MAASARSIFFMSAILLLKPSALAAVDPLPTGKFVELRGLRLHYVDWGGRGDVLLRMRAYLSVPDPRAGCADIGARPISPGGSLARKGCHYRNP